MNHSANDSRSQTQPHDDLLRAAAFFDGEGCVNVTKSFVRTKQPQYRLQVVLTNTYLPILEWYQGIWDGRIHQLANNRSQLTDNPRGCFSLWWTGRHAAEVLTQWEPFMMVKGEITRNALAFQAIKNRAYRGGRETPAGILDQLERHYQIHRRLSSREVLPGEQIAALMELAEPSDQLELLEDEG